MNTNPKDGLPIKNYPLSAITEETAKEKAEAILQKHLGINPNKSDYWQILIAAMLEFAEAWQPLLPTDGEMVVYVPTPVSEAPLQKSVMCRCVAGIWQEWHFNNEPHKNAAIKQEDLSIFLKPVPLSSLKSKAAPTDGEGWVQAEEKDFMHDLHDMLCDLFDSEIDINISFQKVVEFNAKYNIL